MIKRCSKCNVEKPLDRFAPDPRAKLGRHPVCNPCKAAIIRERRSRDPEYCAREALRTKEWRKKNYRKNRYGISNEEFHALLAAQGEKCAICGTNEPKAFGWAIDHDHESGRVRGLLCVACNTALGGYEKMFKLVGHNRLYNYLKG